MSFQDNHWPELKIVTPQFGSPLTRLILELEHLRRKELRGTTLPALFGQLKRLFHLAESLGSARIEGNRTTLVEFYDSHLEPEEPFNKEGIREIKNIDEALTFIEEVMVPRPETPVNRAFLCELHKKVVRHLDREGDRTPGEYRKANVIIMGSTHTPTDACQVDLLMQELCDFINRNDEPQYHLLKTAIAHHRFAWIHPFSNGNGRVARLLTYTMLVKLGFRVGEGRILNPTAAFCNRRQFYYENLERADSGNEADILHWCEFALGGIKDDIEKIDNLLDYEYLKKEILFPALAYVQERRWVDHAGASVLRKVIERQIIQNKDIQTSPRSSDRVVASRLINQLIAKGMLCRTGEGKRSYHLSIENRFFIRGVLRQLDRLGFLPEMP
ncbi:MAG: Fic family protein [Planctomycetaceae bacterium]|nr:Fic family protein [Planctomycetaceae bacterium]